MTNFTYTELNQDLIEGSITEAQAIEQLQSMNTSYSRAIAEALINGNINEFIVLLNKSMRFEANMNKNIIESGSITLTNDEIIARANNLMAIHGIDYASAYDLSYRRAERLNNKYFLRSHSIQHGTFLV